MRVRGLLIMWLMVFASYARASCLEDFQAHMGGIFHHGPYQIDGAILKDQSEYHSEVKFIFPDRLSIKVYNSQGDLISGAINIESHAWRLDHNGHWVSFSGEDFYSLKNEISRGSGDFRLATHVACPDPLPNNVNNYTNYQFNKPFSDGKGSYMGFIKFNNANDLPVRSVLSWSSQTHSGEDVFEFRFDPYIHVDPPISDTDP